MKARIGKEEIERRRPKAMLRKLISDSNRFFEAAIREWDEAAQLAMKSEENKSPRRKDAIVLRTTESDTQIAIESALSVAMTNYMTAVELLLKGFIGVEGGFSAEAVRKTMEKNHMMEQVVEDLPENWKEELERLYKASKVSDIEVAVLWNWWNPPTGEWIEETSRLECPTLNDFLKFLNRERMHLERYSYEKIVENDFRVKLVKYEKLEMFQRSVEDFLWAEAKEMDWWQPDNQVLIKGDGERARPVKVQLKPRDRWEIDRRGQRCKRRCKSRPR